MLNISPNRINDRIDIDRFKTIKSVEEKKSGKVLLRLLIALFFVGLIIMFLPWTQNIRARGTVTTLKPQQRHQTIHSIIPGRIEKWFVQEGDHVNKGDTILYITEVKDQYLDPDLLDRTEQQLKAQEMTVASYMEKVQALDNQVDALVQTSRLKLEQAKNKLEQARLQVHMDSTNYGAAQINYEIAKEQYERMKKLQEDGLKSLTDLENRKLTMRKAEADMIAARNKLLSSENQVINAMVELNSIQAQYRDQIAKAESEKFTAMSSMYDAETKVTKLQNQFMNYSVRKGMYYITAPQDGYVTKTIQSGIGETIKEGEAIVSIMPEEVDLAVEIFVKPIDLPLLDTGQTVRIQFDGWPAIVFSGWPNVSYGTYGGRIYAIDKFISDNGKYRILVAPDESDHPWPNALRAGAGTNAMILLKDVPIWYELWRKFNGFPPDYYKGDPNIKQSNSKSTH